ncbi:CBO0543 family protein [Aquibacillus rhizosphaerae]|uniref:CBO0543 family protein n=1 Tax=Aquibacillus rhizosphaerae TaxID=3051431 RepID=A0ABT7LAZ8_9BACI|nr:CBO0543 family protein [Aquibacillus sp. LR5S19]MDL4843046.1 CBO0543 family protein [Aquibacillus sp. LR5S19]
MNQYINFHLSIEFYIYLTITIIGSILLYYFLKIDWKRYGLLFILATIIGNGLCYLFVSLGFYSYPYLLFPALTVMPFTTVTLSFPILVLMTIRYSPSIWAWKIPFYWTIIHIGMFWETYALNKTQIIEYNFKWDLWDSYTWWWIFFLLFEWIGSLIIPDNLRKPLDIRHLRYGKMGWAIIHIVLIITIFLAGYYLGSLR